jgi:hypothetical protein
MVQARNSLDLIYTICTSYMQEKLEGVRYTMNEQKRDVEKE